MFKLDTPIYNKDLLLTFLWTVRSGMEICCLINLTNIICQEFYPEFGRKVVRRDRKFDPSSALILMGRRSETNCVRLAVR